MVFEDLSPIEALVEKKDLAALERLTVSGQRVRFRPVRVRSALMLSTHNLRHLNKLDELEADWVVLNLEDGVAPSLKPLALRLCGLFLSEAKSLSSMTVVRINPLDEGGEEEIDYLNRIRPDAIRVPKIRDEKEVERALALIDPAIGVHLSIETAEAWLALGRLRVHRRVEAFYLGALDLLADLGIAHRVIEPGNPTMDAVLARFLLHGRAQGIEPVSFVFQDYKDLSAFRRWCEYEKRMGYGAKGCISPAQVAIANAVFTPDEAELERAKKIVALFESDATRSDFADETLGFVDEPVYKGAKRLLAEYGA